MDEFASPHLIPLAALILGLVFGITVQRSDWCAMGAVSDIVLMSDWRRMRSWLLAIATAIVGTYALIAVGAIDLAGTSYLRPDVRFLAAALGGLAFGFGMTRTGGCISKNLVRLGGGSLRSVVVLMVVAIAALATMAGPLVWLPLLLEAGALSPGAGATDQGLPALLGGGDVLGPVIAVVIAAALAWFCLKDRRFRARRPLVAAGFVLGALVPLGWLATTWLADPFEPVPITSLNYVGASASTLILATTGSGSVVSFGAALVIGTVLGGLAVTLSVGRVRLEGFADAKDLRRNLVGAALMGTGGVLAGGCTVGQGLTGISTLGLTSFLAVGAIVAGAVVGVRTLETDGFKGALRALAGG